MRQRGRRKDQKKGSKLFEKNKKFDPNSLQRVSPTYYKDKVDKTKYSFALSKGWTYEDKEEVDLWDGFEDIKVPWLHLILNDKNNTPRVTLAFKKEKGKATIIYGIQRERTQYSGKKGERKWDSELETKKAREFQKELGRLDPSSFLFSEFLHLNKKAILNGEEIFLNVFPKTKKVYYQILKMFFKDKPLMTLELGEVFELDLSKKRVRSILGLR